MQEYTQEQTDDFIKRAQDFQLEFDPILADLQKKHQVEILYSPSFIPSPSGIFGISVTSNYGDLKYKSVPSPLNGSLIAE